MKKIGIVAILLIAGMLLLSGCVSDKNPTASTKSGLDPAPNADGSNPGGNGNVGPGVTKTPKGGASADGKIIKTRDGSYLITTQVISVDQWFAVDPQKGTRLNIPQIGDFIIAIEQANGKIFLTHGFSSMITATGDKEYYLTIKLKTETGSVITGEKIELLREHSRTLIAHSTSKVLEWQPEVKIILREFSPESSPKTTSVKMN